MLPVIAIGALAYYGLGDSGYIKSGEATGKSCGTKVDNASFQRSEMRTFGMRPKDNIGYGTNMLELENAPQIIRTADKSNLIKDLRKNAEDFLESARERNQYTGDLNWDKRNRKTIVLPSYFGNANKLIPNVPTPEAVPFWNKIPTARVDRPSGKPYKDLQAKYYLDPFGDNISPLSGYPRSSITSIEKFGNAWGPGGVISRAMIEGGTRGDRIGVYSDYDPKIPKVGKKAVSFAKGTKLH